MKAIAFQVTRQCAHKKPCDAPDDSEAVTPWRSTQTIEAVPPARWTLALLDRFVADLCRQAGVGDLTLVEFRGGPEPGTVKVSGGGHSLSMSLPFIPDAVLGPWLLAHREGGNVWSAVYRPQPKAADGSVLPPLVSGGAR